MRNKTDKEKQAMAQEIALLRQKVEMQDRMITFGQQELNRRNDNINCLTGIIEQQTIQRTLESADKIHQILLMRLIPEARKDATKEDIMRDIVPYMKSLSLDKVNNMISEWWGFQKEEDGISIPKDKIKSDINHQEFQELLNGLEKRIAQGDKKIVEYVEECLDVEEWVDEVD